MVSGEENCARKSQWLVSEVWSLLLSWMPLFGDALTVIAGVLREPLWSFLILVTVAKTGRYLVLAAVTLGATSALGF